MTVRSALVLTVFIAVGVAQERIGRAQEEPDANAIGHACDGGDIRSCVQLGVLYSNGYGVPKDEQKASALFQKACDRGSTAACSNLGSFYAMGRGVPRNGAKAAALYQRACNAGEPAGCYGLGFAYEWGLGVPKDQTKADALYQRACSDGDAAGCSKNFVPSVAERRVTVVAQAPPQLNETLQAAIQAVMPGSQAPDPMAIGHACDRGNTFSCLQLGILYSSGGRVPRDQGRAAALFLRACDRESPLACDLLGFAYEWGIGVPKDQNKATALYQRGCDGGDAAGCSKLNGTLRHTGNGRLNPQD